MKTAILFSIMALFFLTNFGERKSTDPKAELGKDCQLGTCSSQDGGDKFGC